MTQLDFIGDIHGFADKLTQLLKKLEYQPLRKGFRHSSRKVVFVGDFIDRGPHNPEVVEIARAMVDAGDAYAVCGNHEYNAVCFNTLSKNGYIRPHTVKNFKQHSTTILQYHGNQKAYEESIAWFKTLPLYLEHESFRAVHATYDHASIATLKRLTNDGILSDGQYLEMANKDSELFKAVEITCKGKEIALPAGQSFFDKDGTERFEIRLKWWLDTQKNSIKDLSIIEDIKIADNEFLETKSDYYREDQKPVFFGHYWLKGEPNLYRSNICCLDYSVAKDGYMCAYRFNGEKELSNDNLVFV